jgi:hypothetical protein
MRGVALVSACTVTADAVVAAGDLGLVRVGRSFHVAPEAVAAYKRHLVEAGRHTAA